MAELENKNLDEAKNETVLFKVRIVQSLTAQLVFICLLSLFGRYLYFFELLTHFVVYYAVCFGLSVLFFLFYWVKSKKYRSWLIISVLGFLIYSTWLSMSYLSFEEKITTPGQNELKTYFANVLTSNQNVNSLLASIRKKQPDIVGLVEVNSYWIRGLKDLRKEYPYYQEIPKEHNFGIAIYSKRKLDNSFSINFHPSSEPSIIAKITLNNEIVNIIVTHTLPPVSRKYFKLRNLHLLEMAKYTSQLKGHVIVMGDFNLTPWSPFYNDYVKISGQKNVRDGRGVMPTWSVGPITIPLDHVFISKNMMANKFEVLENIGSDHRPIFAKVSFRKLIKRDASK